jgi:hypothetical protein
MCTSIPLSMYLAFKRHPNKLHKTLKHNFYWKCVHCQYEAHNVFDFVLSSSDDHSYVKINKNI